MSSRVSSSRPPGTAGSARLEADARIPAELPVGRGAAARSRAVPQPGADRRGHAVPRHHGLVAHHATTSHARCTPSDGAAGSARGRGHALAGGCRRRPGLDQAALVFERGDYQELRPASGASVVAAPIRRSPTLRLESPGRSTRWGHQRVARSMVSATSQWGAFRWDRTADPPDGADDAPAARRLRRRRTDPAPGRSRRAATALPGGERAASSRRSGRSRSVTG